MFGSILTRTTQHSDLQHSDLAHSAAPHRSTSPETPSARRGSRTVRRLLPGAVIAVLALLSAGPAHAETAESPCQSGVFCAWADHQYHGIQHRVDADIAPLERCVALPSDLEASSFANHTGHPVTVYQDGHCSTNADFQTYPSGTFVPEAPYVARAIKVWTH